MAKQRQKVNVLQRDYTPKRAPLPKTPPPGYTRLYNSQNRTLEDHTNNVARLMLKYNHVKDNQRKGIYVLESEIGKYFDLRPLRAPTKAKPKTKAAKAAAKQTELEDMSMTKLKELAMAEYNMSPEELKGLKKDEIIAAIKEQE